MIQVVAAAVTDEHGRVLITQRPAGKPLAGFWEFPGGKREAGESRTAALARELTEELGIAIREPRPLLRLQHVYPFGEVCIDLWVVTRYSGEPRGLDGQALRWCTTAELAEAALLPADRPIVRALRLPERLTQVATADYVVGGAEVPGSPAGGLVGRWCSGPAETLPIDAAFLVMEHVIADDALAALCETVAVPVYARLPSLERAWVLGATGLNDVPSTGDTRPFRASGRRRKTA